MYLFAVSYVPGSHFWKLPRRRGKAWQTGAKRFERSTLKRSGWSGLPVKPRNIPVAAANCNLLDTPAILARASADFSSFWRNEATNAAVHYALPLVKYHHGAIPRRFERNLTFVRYCTTARRFMTTNRISNYAIVSSLIANSTML